MNPENKQSEPLFSYDKKIITVKRIKGLKLFLLNVIYFAIIILIYKVLHSFKMNPGLDLFANFLLILVIAGVVTFFIGRVQRQREWQEQENQRLVDELKKSLKEIKTLRGLLPICSSCKKIKNDKGYWTELEAYIREHSKAEFSHGICPNCAKELYPELDLSLD